MTDRHDNACTETVVFVSEESSMIIPYGAASSNSDTRSYNPPQLWTQLWTGLKTSSTTWSCSEW